MTSYGGSNLGGGSFNGYAPKQSITNYKDSGSTIERRILRSSWNGQYATGTYGNYKRITTPFRAVNNSGDFLGRVNYTCGGPNPTNPSKPGWRSIIGSIIDSCDNTGVPASSCNTKYIAQSSDYTRFRKQRVYNQNYNDKKF